MSTLSIVIPAHNEEKELPKCLDAIRIASNGITESVEVIVVLNRCTDRTEEIATQFGAKIAREEAKNLSLIRNAGAALATSDIIVTIDADSFMGPGTLQELLEKILSGRHIGGGAFVLPERWSLGICMSVTTVMPYLISHRVSFGMFWCWRKDFEAIGGFNPDFITIEDLDFAKRLKAYGEKRGLSWGTVWRNPIVTSCRKFDQFGDWYIFKNPGFIYRVFKGTNRDVANSFWYDARK